MKEVVNERYYQPEKESKYQPINDKIKLWSLFANIRPSDAKEIKRIAY
jgi:hypothetical protein